MANNTYTTTTVAVNYNQDLIDIVSRVHRPRSPFMLVDLDKIIDNCDRFKKAMPRVSLTYAVKAFYTREIIEAIDPHVDGFDVSSISEIKDLISFGINASRLSYGNPVKSVDAIKKATSLGVQEFAFQSMSELVKLQMHAPGSRVYVRVVNSDLRSFVPLSDKFGCGPSEAIDLLIHAKRVGLVPIGLTFHVGSQLLDQEAWGRAISSANLLIAAARKSGVDVSHVNIGGGFPAPYFTDVPSIEEVSSYVNAALSHDTSISYVAEPGRYVIADAAVLVSGVIGVEQRDNKNWLFIDTGLYQAFLGSMRYEVFPYVPISLSHERDDHGLNKELCPYVLTGPTCDSQDIICNEIMLPNDMALGDLLIFPNMGAYTLAYGSEFNGFKKPKCRYISGGVIQ